MKSQADKLQENQRHAFVNDSIQQQASTDAAFQFVDNRAETAQLRQLQATVDNSPQVKGLAQLQAMVDNSPRLLAQRQIEPEDEELLQGQFASESTTQLAQQPVAKPNNTGLPDNLKSGIENLSGLSMDSIKVHYNSPQPAQLNAHAYAQGTNIHLAPGQEQHLPHEAWHVVQQAQGRVKPTMQVKDGVAVNDDQGLEHEADVMGGKATQMTQKTHDSKATQVMAMPTVPVQRYILPLENDKGYRVSEEKNLVTTLPQSLYATKEMIQSAAKALLAAKSMVTVSEDKSRSPWKPIKGGIKTKTVYPVKLSWVPQTVPNGSVHSKLSGENAKSVLYHSWADCHRTAQTVMGSSSQTGDNQEKPLVKQDEEYKTMEPVSTGKATGAYLSDAQANRGIYALFEYAFPKFVEILAEKKLDVTHSDLIERINGIKTQKFDDAKMNKWWVTYKIKILPNKVLYSLFTKSFGINEQSVPEIGDTLSQVGNEVERFQEKNKAMKLALKYDMAEDTPTSVMRSSGLIPDEELNTLKDLWNFHWAGVIMKDGSDYVTLENLSIENINEVNRKWYFKMYGTEDQSFHTEARDSSSHSGDAPITAGFRHVPEE